MTPTKLLIGTVFSVFAIAVGGVWFATEWAAWHLGFQPQLGAPWFTLCRLSGLSGLAAVRVVVRLRRLCARPSSTRRRRSRRSSGFAGCGVAIVGSLWRARQTKHVTTYGSSRWATDREITEAGLFDPAGVFLGRLDRPISAP